jgi:intein/homing endonuclease
MSVNEKTKKIESDYSKYIAMSRYARYQDGLDRRETWKETVTRLCSFWKEKYPDLFPYEEMHKHIESMDDMPSMRSLMTAGKALDRDQVSGYNPVVGSTRVVTREFGNVAISSLKDKTATVLNIDGKWTQAFFRSYGCQNIFSVNTKLNSNTEKTVGCTGNHRWVLQDGTVKSTSELKAGDRIKFVSAQKPELDEDYELGVRHGIIYGDGTATKTCERVKGYHIRLCGDSKELISWFSEYPVAYPPSANGDPVIMMYDAFAATHSLKQLPPETESDSYLLGFIRGWMAADGSVTKTSQVSLCTSDSGLEWLQNNGERLGFVIQRVYKQSSETNYGKRRQNSYVIYISRSSCTKEDFLCSWKRNNFQELNSHFVVSSVEETQNVEEVFCAEVPETNTFVIEGGMVTGNCSYLPINDPRCFDEAMYILMCGTGVGFSVERQEVCKLPSIPDELFESETVIKVKDSKIGWCTGLRELISLLYAGKIPKWDLSGLRPAGSRLKTFGGRSSGPQPLNDVYSFIVSIFKRAAGRKLTSIECHDIVCKIAECVVVGGVRRSALISLSNLSDERMRDAKTGQWWEKDVQRALANNSVAYTEKPEIGIFMKEWLSLYNSKSGERGIVNRHSAKKNAVNTGRRDPNHDFGTNPCLTSDTWIFTDSGAKQVKDLVGIPFTAILDGKKYPSTSQGFFSSGIKQVYQVKLKNGMSIKCTGNHKFLTKNGWKKVEEMGSDEHIILDNNQGLHTSWGSKRGDFEKGWLLGSLYGDGNIAKDTANLDFWGDNRYEMQNLSKMYLTEFLGCRTDCGTGIGQPEHDRVRIGSLSLREHAIAYDMYDFDTKSKKISELVEKESSDFTRGFLCGWFDADGSVQGNHKKGISVRLSSSDLKALQYAQRSLSRLGIVSKIYENRHDAGYRLLPDGNGGYREYHCNATHELVVSNKSVQAYSEIVGFKDSNKNSRLMNYLSSYKREMNCDKFSSKIKSIIAIGEQEVFDCQIPEKNAFSANGLVSHNCGEISLRPFGFCNLSEVIVREDDTLESLLNKVRVATIIGTFQSTLVNFRYLRSIWKKNAEEERLLGVSLTGIMDHPTMSGKDGKEILEAWLAKLKQCAIDTNKEWAEKLGINQSASITCVKPSGTVSQLVNSSSGIHPRYSKYYIRTVRADKTDPLALFLMIQGVPCEDDVTKPNSTYVFSFPMKSPDNAVTAPEISAIEQLELYLTYQRYWTEHNVSITVYVREHEWMEVGAWVYKHFDEIGGVSFLPYSDHVYKQAPYQPISKEQYEKLALEFPDINWEQFIESGDTTKGAQEYACVSGMCELI